MAFITWNENDFGVRVTEFDSQHKQLIGIINKLYDGMQQEMDRKELLRIFVELTQYTISHFSAEEFQMKKYNYPHFEDHKKEHETLVNQVKDLKEKFYSGEVSITGELFDFLKNWLFIHIQKNDRKYSAFFDGVGFH